MRKPRIPLLIGASIPLVLCVAAGGFRTASADEDRDDGARGFRVTPVAAAAPKTPGIAVPDALSPELIEVVMAQGATPLENPASVTVGTSSVLLPFYGYNGNGPMVPLAGDVQSATHNVEASKTEPDKNTYLVLHNQEGADPDYDYGQHFLFQGHEAGLTGYITRINLDADELHRVTLMAALDRDGKRLPPIDGSTWDPFAQRLLFTSEAGTSGGVWQATLGFPSVVEDISGSLGRGGYEAIQNDSDGNLIIIEDVGGPTGTVNTHARQPNSFIYRFVPRRVDDLHEGKLQALQVISLRTGQPIAFHPGQADADILSADVGDLHTYGKVFPTRWITVHDTAVDGVAPFGANALAKAKLATPFKRPENGQFQPGTGFRRFFFDETGDTDARTEAGSAFGGFGSIMMLSQARPSADTGTLTMFYRSDIDHAAFDNVGFVGAHQIVFVEDRGDTLHTQHNALDSAWLFDTRVDYANPANQPVRILAQGRDTSATIDSSLQGAPGFQNDGDNEITGFHCSNGDVGRDGILGGQVPRPFRDGWRIFYTQQHGDNFTREILANPHPRHR
jgi:hypothetical protein